MRYIVDYSVERPRDIVTGYVFISAESEAQAEEFALVELIAEYPDGFVEILLVQVSGD